MTLYEKTCTETLLTDVVLRYYFRVKDKYKLQQTFTVDPLYLRHENSSAATDFMVLRSHLDDRWLNYSSNSLQNSKHVFFFFSALADSSQPTFPFP